MNRFALILSLVVASVTFLSAQQNIRTFIFGHSLINHEIQVNPTPSQETSVPHWFQLFANAGGHDYAVSGQYGFLPQHVNVPPIAQWGFDLVEGAWDSDNEPFSAANFNTILITPGNFIQWQSPTENYPSDNITPVEATEIVFNWCIEQEEGLQFYIYENWPDMGGFLNNGFPPTSAEWIAYNDYLNGDFHEWFIEYHKLVKESFPDACISMIPVGPIISKLLSQDPYSLIPVNELYEDDAPHGRATTYFLASLITYMAMLEEKVSMDFIVDPIIHPTISSNYQDVVDFIWNELQTYVNEEGQSSVFCNSPTVNTTALSNQERPFTITPNPTEDVLFFTDVVDNYFISIYNMQGNLVLDDLHITAQDNAIGVSSLVAGVYTIVTQSLTRDKIFINRFIKI